MRADQKDVERRTGEGKRKERGKGMKRNVRSHFKGIVFESENRHITTRLGWRAHQRNRID